MKTIAIFSTDKCPDREPDFLSNSCSAYWDMGHGVVRSSDHWAGWSLCTGQASCIWGFKSTGPAAHAWKTGYCAYPDFQTRRLVPILQTVTERDRTIAMMIRDAGGFIDYSSWSDPSVLPAWAAVYRADCPMLPADICSRALKNKESSRVIYARPSQMTEILRGAREIRIGQKLEEPDWSWDCKKDQTMV